MATFNAAATGGNTQYFGLVNGNNIQSLTGSSTQMTVTSSDVGGGQVVFTVHGTGFTYSGSTVTGGTISSLDMSVGGVNQGTFTLSAAATEVESDNGLLEFLNGSDTINGGAGNDVLWGGNDGADTFSGNGGDDTYLFTSIFEPLHVGAGFTINGGSGVDRIVVSGYDLDLRFATLSSIDRLDIGYGNTATARIDTAQLGTDLAANLAVQLVNGTDTLYVYKHLAGSFSLSSLNFLHGAVGNVTIDCTLLSNDDVINGGSTNDTILGGDGTDVLSGLGGNDLVSGMNGADTLDGGPGNDTLDGGPGNDTLDGGADNDILRILGSQGLAEIFNGGAGVDRLQVMSTASAVLNGFNAAGSSIEQWAGNGKGLVGTSAHNLFNMLGLTSKSGLPFVDSGAGNDTIYGSNFADDLRGGAGDDVIKGYGGNDMIHGGAAKDTLTGGAGSDVFVFDTAPNATTNRDTITDFANASGNNDTFRLENAVFTKLGAPGALAAAKFFVGAAAHDADDRIIYNHANGALFYDSNGIAAGGSIQFATLPNHATLTASDFVVI